MCVTGQLRTLSMKPDDPLYPTTWLPQKYRDTPPAEELAGRTVAETVQANFYPGLLAAGGDFDVFMVVATRGGPREPAAGDVGACEPLRPPARDGARAPHLHCDVYDEAAAALRGDPIGAVWAHYSPPGPPYELQFMQQLYDLWRCMDAVRARERLTGVRYTHVVRTRPDVAWYAPLAAPLAALDFGTADAPLVLKTDDNACCCGNDDWFNVGTREVMGRFMDRFLYLNALKHSLFDDVWTAEDYARHTLQRFGAALRAEPMLTGCLLKPSSRVYAGEP